jgi:putative acetyltransferase
LPLSKLAIRSVDPSRYPQLLAVWEASVRATHDFLSEADIAALKPLILESYFDAVDLRCVVAEDGRVLGFVGMAGEKIEMLFIAPEHRGRGIGTLLARHASGRHDATKVDVN